jgi:hypothetical protein
MNTLGKVLLAAGILVTALFIICIALIAVSLDQSASESFESLYTYELKISTSGPIEDAVLLIPFLPATIRIPGQT